MNQCSCDKKMPHDMHCWYCQAPIIWSESRKVYITNKGHIAACCARKVCIEHAEACAQDYGIPKQDV